jgi:Flp pilus assembly pilin Flp
MLIKFLRCESGATAMEYALLATIVAVGLAATFAILGDTVLSLFSSGTGTPGEAISGAANSMN